jgi:hypothetical protein
MALKNKILVIGEYTPEQLVKLETEFEPIFFEKW